MSKTSHLLPAAAAIAMMASVIFPASAVTQQPTAIPTRSFVQVVRLKPEMVTDWVDLQRNEVIPALRKAGLTTRTTLVTVVGNTFEYVMLTPFPSFAAMDGDAPLVRALSADGAARLNARLRRCILTQHSYMTNRIDSLTIPAADAPVWRVQVRRILPGKMQEYLKYYHDEVLPGLKKAKASGTIAGSTIAIRGAGAPQTGEFTTVTYYSKFADLDNGDPLVQALGREAAAQVNAKNALFATNSQVVIRRRIVDLSF